VGPGYPGALKVPLIDVGWRAIAAPRRSTRLRWLRYIMVLIALAGAVGAYVYQRAAIEREMSMVDSTRIALMDLNQRMRYLKATERIELNDFGWPELIDPRWFKGETPRNSMLSARHPWLEVASTMEYALDHPVQRVAINERLAGLWYNPAKGILRARVPQTVSDKKAIELYNRVNGAKIVELFDSSPKRRILEDLLRDEEDLKEFEEERQSGVVVHRPGDDAPSDEPPTNPDQPDPEDEDDPAGPVPVDEPPASDGAPVEVEDEPTRGETA
jgi:hypothetical protein